MPEQLGSAPTSGKSLMPLQPGRAPAPGSSELWGGEEEKQHRFCAYLWPYVMVLLPVWEKEQRSVSVWVLAGHRDRRS